MSRRLSTGGRRVACHDHDAARRWATCMSERPVFLCATLRIRAANSSRCCYVSDARCTSPRGTRRDDVEPVNGSESVLATATPLRACRRMIRTWRCRRRHRPCPSTAARSPSLAGPDQHAGSRRQDRRQTSHRGRTQSICFGRLPGAQAHPSVASIRPGAATRCSNAPCFYLPSRP